MHIALVSNLYPPDVLGGYELLAQDVARKLQDAGHRVTVVTSGRGVVEKNVFRVLRLSRPFGDPARADRLRHVVAALFNARRMGAVFRRAGPFDAVLAMSQRRLGLTPLRVLARAGCPIVFTVNDDWPVAYRTPRAPGLLGRATGRAAERLLPHTFRGIPVRRVVYLSRSIRTWVRSEVASLPEGIVMGQGVDLARFPARSFHPMGRSLELLFVGRLHPSKGPEHAIDALFFLRKAGMDARLTLAGAPVSSAYAEELRARATGLGVLDHTRLLGQVSREALPSLYRAADALLFVSVWAGEAQGLTYFEAMASGVPVVAIAAGGARETLEAHPEAVSLVSHPSGEAMAAELVALRASPERQRAQVRAALRMVQTEASLDRYVQTLEQQLALAAAESSSGMARVPA